MCRSQTVDRYFVGDEIAQAIFIEIAAGENRQLVKTSSIENGAHVARMFAEVAAVDAHAVDSGAAGFQSSRQVNRLGCGSLDVIGVEEQDDIPGVRSGECSKAVISLSCA